MTIQPTFTLTPRADGGVHISSPIAGFTLKPGDIYHCYTSLNNLRMQLRIEELETTLAHAIQMLGDKEASHLTATHRGE